MIGLLESSSAPPGAWPGSAVGGEPLGGAACWEVRRSAPSVTPLARLFSRAEKLDAGRGGGMAALVFPERSSASRIGVELAAFVPEFAPGFLLAALAPGPPGSGGAGAAFCGGGGLPGPVDLVGAGAAPFAGGRCAPVPGANGDGVGDGDGTAPGGAAGVFTLGAPGRLTVGPIRASASRRSCLQRSSIVR
jgi:hypothetical protein